MGWEPRVFLHLDPLPIIHPHVVTQALKLWMARPESLAESVDFSATQRWMHSVGLGHGTQRHHGEANSSGGELRMASLQGLLKQRALSGVWSDVCPREDTRGVCEMGKCETPFPRHYPLGGQLLVREGFWLDRDESCSSLTRKMHNLSLLKHNFTSFINVRK